MTALFGFLPAKAKTAASWLFLASLFMMVTGDFPRFPFGIRERHLILLVFSWPKLYLVLLLLAFLLLILSSGFHSERYAALSRFKIPIASLAGAFLISSLASSRQLYSLHSFLIFGGFLFLLAALLYFAADDALQPRIKTVLVIAVSFLALRVILWRLGEGLAMGTYHLKNNSWLGKLQIAWVLNFFAPCLFVRYLRAETALQRGSRAAAWLVSAGAILLIYARTGVLAFLLTSCALALFHSRLWKRWLPLYLALALLVLCTALSNSFTWSYLWGTTSRFYEEPGFVRRLGIWRETARMVRDRPLTGAGLGAYDDIAYTQYRTPFDTNGAGNGFFRNGWHAHNLPLHLLAEAGLLGAGAFCLLWLSILRFLIPRFRGESPASAAAAGLILCFFFLSLTENPMALRVHESLRMNLTFWFLLFFLMHREEGGKISA